MTKENQIVVLKVEPGPENDMSLVLFGKGMDRERESKVYERYERIKSKLGDRFPPRRRDSSLRSE